MKFIEQNNSELYSSSVSDTVINQDKDSGTSCNASIAIDSTNKMSIDSMRYRILFCYKKFTNLTLNVDKHNPVALILNRETSSMCAQIRNGRNKALQSMVHNNAAARTIDCTWCCDMSVSSDAAVKFLTVSMNLADYDSLLRMPIIDDDVKMCYFIVNKDHQENGGNLSFLTQIHF